MILYNDQKVEIKQFPNGESLLEQNLFRAANKNVLTLYYESDADLFQLYLIRKALDFPVSLRIPYMPYSRMDRASNEYTFTLKHFSEFVNSLDFEHVYIYEPHSDVTMALIDRSVPIGLVRQILKKTDFKNAKDFVLFPDATANKRYSQVIQAGWEITGYKKRDFKTGKLTHMEIANVELVDGKRVFIVDDLCSKGGTFLMAAEKLHAMGATEVNLVVAHCEETIWKGKLLDTSLIKWIYTTNTIPHKVLSSGKLTIYDYASL